MNIKFTIQGETVPLVKDGMMIARCCSEVDIKVMDGVNITFQLLKEIALEYARQMNREAQVRFAGPEARPTLLFTVQPDGRINQHIGPMGRLSRLMTQRELETFFHPAEIDIIQLTS